METAATALAEDLLAHGSPEQFYEVPKVNAAAWVIPASVVKTLGGFDTLFFM